jgi:hypothetical protein
MNQLIIFSVDGNVSPFELKFRRNVAKESMIAHGITWNVLEGEYDGVIEDSYAIPYTSDNWELVCDLCSEFNQHSMLLVDDRNSAWLYYVRDQLSAYAGQFKSVSEHVARRWYHGYSKVTKTGQYYVIDSSRFI